MKSKKKLYKTCTPILFFCIFAVSITIGIPHNSTRFLIVRQSSQPSILGIITSVITIDTGVFFYDFHGFKAI